MNLAACRGGTWCGRTCPARRAVAPRSCRPRRARRRDCPLPRQRRCPPIRRRLNRHRVLTHRTRRPRRTHQRHHRFRRRPRGGGVPSPLSDPSPSEGAPSSPVVPPVVSVGGSSPVLPFPPSGVPPPSLAHGVPALLTAGSEGQTSHASPAPSPSVSSWSSLAVCGQLSTSPQIRSASASFSGSSGHCSATTVKETPALLVNTAAVSVNA